MPGRFIGDSVTFLRNVVSYATSSNIPVAILSLDQEKAFDRVDWSFLKPLWLGWVLGPSLSVRSACFTPAPECC